jgi:CDP-diacylglycerol---glycerol-3-phosphate 3-phosphatidyltransferase
MSRIFTMPYHLALMAVGIIWVRVRPGLPTAISICRIASAWYLFELFYAGHRYLFFAVAIAAASSDWLDGYLARKWSCESRFGALMDLMGDKALCLALMYLGLAVWGLEPWFAYPCGVLVTYHATVMALRALGFVRPSSSRVAKTKMLTEATSLILCFSSFSLGPSFALADWVGIAALWFAASLSFWSMFEYLGILPDWPLRYWPRRT